MSNFDLHKDGGYKSRKLTIAYVSMGLVLAGFLTVAKYPELSVVYPEFCTAILASAALYQSSNAAVKWITTKTPKAIPPEVK